MKPNTAEQQDSPLSGFKPQILKLLLRLYCSLSFDINKDSRDSERITSSSSYVFVVVCSCSNLDKRSSTLDMSYSAAFTVSLISCSLVLNSSFKSDIADVNAFCTIVSTSVAVITTGLVSSDLVDADPDLDDLIPELISRDNSHKQLICSIMSSLER